MWKKSCFVSSWFIMCIFNTCDSPVMCHKMIAMIVQLFNHTQDMKNQVKKTKHAFHTNASLALASGSLTWAHSTFNNSSSSETCDSRIHVQVHTLLQLSLFGCVSARVMCEVLSPQSCERCAVWKWGAAAIVAASSVCLRLPWQLNTKISLP